MVDPKMVENAINVLQNVVTALQNSLNAQMTVAVVCNDNFSFQVQADNFNQITAIAVAHGGVKSVTRVAA